MTKEEFITIPQLAEILGISRIAVYKKVKKGQIEAVRIGRNYAIPRKYIAGILGKTLNKKEKDVIEHALRKTMKEHGDVLRILGNE